MGIWNRWSENFYRQYGEKWFAKGECTLDNFLNLMKKANRSVRLVTGEADPDLYNRKDVVAVMEDLLIDSVSIDMMFHKEETKNGAVYDLVKHNPRLVSLKEKHSKLFHLYWQRRRCPVHFTVVDQSHILMEDSHGAYQPRGVLIKYKTEILGERWDKRFDQLREKETEEITVDEILKAKQKNYAH